jgi:hypothetical protein
MRSEIYLVPESEQKSLRWSISDCQVFGKAAGAARSILLRTSLSMRGSAQSWTPGETVSQGGYTSSSTSSSQCSMIWVPREGRLGISFEV